MQYYFSNVRFMTNLMKTINFISQFTFTNRYINLRIKYIKIITYAIKHNNFYNKRKNELIAYKISLFSNNGIIKI
jgi:hypothetical protein